MALYVAIDDAYSVTKLNGLQAVVGACSNYTLQDGTPVTLTVAKKALASGSFNVYAYNEEDLQEARDNGFVRGVDWDVKIQKI